MKLHHENNGYEVAAKEILENFLRWQCKSQPCLSKLLVELQLFMSYNAHTPKMMCIS